MATNWYEGEASRALVLSATVYPQAPLALFGLVTPLVVAKYPRASSPEASPPTAAGSICAPELVSWNGALQVLPCDAAGEEKTKILEIGGNAVAEPTKPPATA